MIDDETLQVPTRARRGPWDDRRVRSRAKLPALTLLFHPDCRRVGDRVILHELATGLSVGISRAEPDFAAPGEDRARPLDDIYLSRKPLRLEHDAKAGHIRLTTGASPTSVVVDGMAVDDERIIPAEEVERGVVIELGGRVVVLLHSHSNESVAQAGSAALVGASDAMVRLQEEIRIVAGLDLPVLLRGETGTGKELVAESIHAASDRSSAVFLGLNMGAITPSLAASELFGAVKGAFTGAVKSNAGYFQRAHGGTLFLDEIGESPAEVQVMLLRVLETGQVQRVGDQDPRQVDVRLISATDADLEEAIDEGRFREPLLHRLAGYEISIPPLRERRDDLGRLFFHFLRQELQETGEEHRLAPPAADGNPWLPMSIIARLARYDWPGNVRQLRNVARQLVVSSRGSDSVQVPAPVERLLRDVVAIPAAPDTVQESAPSAGKKPGSDFRKPSEVTEDELLEALRSNRWELKPTAAELRISRGSLYNLIARSKRLRKASDLSESEITECHKRCDGNLDRMVEELEISRSGLQMRMRALGIESA